jgi:pimeloyl-ACP methyl ester carboxylesterase
MAKITPMIIFVHGINSDPSTVPSYAWRRALHNEEYAADLSFADYDNIFKTGFRSRLRHLVLSLCLPLKKEERQFIGDGLGDILDFFLYSDIRDSIVSRINTAIDTVETAFPGKPIVLVGHSLGTVVITEALRARQRKLQGVVLIGSPFSSKIDFIKSMTRRFFGWGFVNLCENAGTERIDYVAGKNDLVSGDLLPVDPWRNEVAHVIMPECGHTDCETLLKYASISGTILGDLKYGGPNSLQPA